MFFYAFLFVASFCVAVIVVWAYRSVTGAGRKVYKTILPSAKSRSALDRHLDQVAIRNRVRGAASPWGSNDRTGPEQYARVVSQTRSSRRYPGMGAGGGESGSGNTAKYQKPRTGLALGSERTWACRDEEFEFAGKTYTVKRQA